ncbi:traB domain-containing protein [Cylas formicarius]|uniref:traB domain-containing protein n=1 Tax=Cylas formicarius TaxID=197179 RepID=UPI0029585EFB|nr:traB domain-containing protein [Cylas formicarius]XP_060518608.1 traB domain-containing protein [Cylas formicarius]
MDHSLTNFELSESTVKIDSESSSDKSDPIEILGDYDAESSGSGSKLEDDFDSNLPSTVTLLKHEATGTKLYLIGTAHFSKESQDDVEKVIRHVQPHCVVLELCRSRTNILELDEKTILEEAKKMDMQKIVSTIKSNGIYNGLMYILLLNMSSHITKEIGMAPGGEFRVAYREASKLPHCIIRLGDRPISITIRRALARLSWFQTFKLAWHLLTSKDPISVEEIEKCKNRDMLEQLLADLAGEYPAFREVFLDERDIYLTNALQEAAVSKHPEGGAEPLKVVGVVGIGHTPGIIRLWPHSQKNFLKGIMVVPPPTLISRILRYSFRLTMLGLGGYFVYKLIPVPKAIRETFHLITAKVINNIKTSPFKYSIN